MFCFPKALCWKPADTSGLSNIFGDHITIPQKNNNKKHNLMVISEKYSLQFIYFSCQELNKELDLFHL